MQDIIPDERSNMAKIKEEMAKLVAQNEALASENATLKATITTNEKSQALEIKAATAETQVSMMRMMLQAQERSFSQGSPSSSNSPPIFSNIGM